MKAAQNVLKMSIVSPDTSRKTATPLMTDGYKKLTTIEWFSFLHSTTVTLTVSVSVFQDVIKIKRLMQGYNSLCWKCNCSCVLSTDARA